MTDQNVLKSITTGNGEAELHLTPTEVVMGLSQETHDDAVQQMRQAQAQVGNGWLAKLVKGALSLGERALDHHVSVPLSNIKAARVENGELKFDYVAGPPKFGFNQIQVSGKDAMKSFSEADLQAFADAVNAEVAKRS